MKDEELTKEERDEELTEQEREDALEHGKCVYYFSSDEGMCSGWAAIDLWKGRYWAASDDDVVDGGPFATLEEALKGSGLNEFPVGCSVSCHALTEARLLPLLKVLGGDYFILNERCRIRKMVRGTERWVLGEPQEW